MGTIKINTDGVLAVSKLLVKIEREVSETKARIKEVKSGISDDILARRNLHYRFTMLVSILEKCGREIAALEEIGKMGANSYSSTEKRLSEEVLKIEFGKRNPKTDINWEEVEKQIVKQKIAKQIDIFTKTAESWGRSVVQEMNEKILDFKDIFNFSNKDGNNSEESIKKERDKALKKLIQVDSDGDITYNWDFFKDLMNQNLQRVSYGEFEALYIMYGSMTEDEDIERFINYSYIVDSNMKQKDVQNLLEDYLMNEFDHSLSAVDSYNVLSNDYTIWQLSPVFKALAFPYGKHLIYPLCENTYYNETFRDSITNYVDANREELNTMGFDVDNAEGYAKEMEDFAVRESSKAAILENILVNGKFFFGNKSFATDNSLPFKIKRVGKLDVYDYVIDAPRSYMLEEASFNRQTIKVYDLRDSSGVDSAMDECVKYTINDYKYKVEDVIVDLAFLGVDINAPLPGPMGSIYSMIMAGMGMAMYLEENRELDQVIRNVDFANRAQRIYYEAVMSKVGNNYIINYAHIDREKLQQDVDLFNEYIEDLEIEGYRKIAEEFSYTDEQIRLLDLNNAFFTIEDMIDGFYKTDEASILKFDLYYYWIDNRKRTD
ncbi:MAG: hypothetical protein K0R15_760 [Clostridiales bacterium]|jgi:hypothetical protein|nr:hypothetical protein [Clostridiales bacterium]